MMRVSETTTVLLQLYILDSVGHRLRAANLLKLTEARLNPGRQIGGRPDSHYPELKLTQNGVNHGEFKSQKDS